MTHEVEFSLDDEAWNEWVDILNRPITDKPRLAELFMQVSIFNEDQGR